MKSRWGASILGMALVGGAVACSPALAADAPAASGTAAPAAVAPAMAPSGSRIAADLKYYEQLNALNLSTAQVNDIAGMLGRLAQMDATHAQRSDAALAPVAPQLARVRTALLTGQTLAADDTTPISAAEKPLAPEAVQLEKLRHDTADAIRQELGPSQMDAVRAFLGLQPDPTFGGRWRGGAPNAPAGGQPGAAQTAVAQPAPTGGTNLTQGGVPLPAQVQPPPSPQDRMAGMLDRLRNAPADQYDRLRDREASRMTRRMGISRRDPTYQTTRAALEDQFNQVRQLPAQQYQQGKTDLANTLITTYPSAAQNGRFGRGFLGAQNDVDTELVRRFFLVPDALVYFHARLMRGR